MPRVLDERRSRIEEDLRGQIVGDVRCDDVFVQLYASDASIHQVRPLGVVIPRSTADVVAVVRYAAGEGLPLHARGAGTGLAGESIGPGLVVDFSKYMRRIIRTGTETVRVQPGVVLARLNEHLASQKRVFGPDPANACVTTMGSVIALDAAGSHWLLHGSTRDHVRSLSVVLADGHPMELGLEEVGLDPPPDDAPASERRKHRLVVDMAEILQRNADLIERHRPRCAVNRSGYQVWDVLVDRQLNLARLLTGSEGTLALTTEATLATSPAPRHRGSVLLLFDRLEKAARAAGVLRPLSPAACDLLDRRHLGLAREADPRYELLIPAAAEAVLVVEFQADERSELADRIREAVDRACVQHELAVGSRPALDAHDSQLFEQLPQRVVPTLHRIRGASRAVPCVEDVAVPPEELPDFLSDLQGVLKKHQVTAALFGHVGHGQLHVRPFLDPQNPEDQARLIPLAEELYEAVWARGGTISGEHGDGLSRTPYVRRQFGELYPVFQEIKAAFDAAGSLNPGKKLGDDPHQLARHLRPPASRLIELQLNWQPGEFESTVRACSGCGACRAQTSDVRMCPVFRIAPQEESSPRAKANVLRGVLTGELPPTMMADDELKAVADLCVNCHMCRLECPAAVDIPKLVHETKGAYVAVNGLRVSDWLMARLDVVAAFGNRFHRLVNWSLRSRRMRWLLERLAGIARERKLPQFAGRTFLELAARRRLLKPTRGGGRKVLYFVDTYANSHDTQLAESLVSVLEHNHVSVYVHPAQKISGMSMISIGALAMARDVARHNVRLLAEAVRQGYEIVTTEPSAALCLKREYPQLLEDEDAQLVAEHTHEATSYLWALHRAGRLLLDFRPVHAALAYHQPCHLRALEVGAPGFSLLRLIPGLRVQHRERGCSGMAGTFGLKRENYRDSLRAGWGLISSLREASVQAGTTECSACKMQMEQGTDKPTIHPLKLLALAYGLKPEIGALLTTRGRELVVS